jgi:hypothetical protein
MTLDIIIDGICLLFLHLHLNMFSSYKLFQSYFFESLLPHEAQVTNAILYGLIVIILALLDLDRCLYSLKLLN